MLLQKCLNLNDQKEATPLLAKRSLIAQEIVWKMMLVLQRSVASVNPHL